MVQWRLARSPIGICLFASLAFSPVRGNCSVVVVGQVLEGKAASVNAEGSPFITITLINRYYYLVASNLAI